MNKYVKWIQQQVEKANRDIQEAQERLSTWTAALNLAREQEEEATDSRTVPTKARASGTSINDLAEQVLKEYGPLDSRTLLGFVMETRPGTNLNTLTVSLNRQRPSRFDRNEKNEWCLVSDKLVQSSPEDDIPF